VERGGDNERGGSGAPKVNVGVDWRGLLQSEVQSPNTPDEEELL